MRACDDVYMCACIHARVCSLCMSTSICHHVHLLHNFHNNFYKSVKNLTGKRCLQSQDTKCESYRESSNVGRLHLAAPALADHLTFANPPGGATDPSHFSFN